MKLNFWQWLGLIILVVAGGYWVYSNYLVEPVPKTQAQPQLIGPAPQ
jgi:hypothetical protein